MTVANELLSPLHEYYRG